MEIKKINHSKVGEIFYFTESETSTLWVSGAKFAKAIGYKNPSASISDNLNKNNKRQFQEFTTIKSKKIRSNTIFLNLEGINEH